MTKTDKLADTPLVVSLDVLEKIIDHCVDVYNIEIEKVPERHKSGYRAGWLGYRVLGELQRQGYSNMGVRDRGIPDSGYKGEV